MPVDAVHREKDRVWERLLLSSVQGEGTAAVTKIMIDRGATVLTKKTRACHVFGDRTDDLKNNLGLEAIGSVSIRGC